VTLIRISACPRRGMPSGDDGIASFNDRFPVFARHCYHSTTNARRCVERVSGRCAVRNLTWPLRSIRTESATARAESPSACRTGARKARAHDSDYKAPSPWHGKFPLLNRDAVKEAQMAFRTRRVSSATLSATEAGDLLRIRAQQDRRDGRT
jgi:hypothetical protein